MIRIALRLWGRRPVRAIGAVALAFVAGCATHPKTPPVYLFYPPAPDQPRLQYLTGFSSEEQLFGQGGFKNFVLGEDRTYKPIGKPYGIATAPGRVHICDTLASTVETIGLKKRSLKYLREGGDGALRVPVNAAVDSEGRLYVADTGREQVAVYSADLRYLGAIGAKGEMKPSGVAVGGDRLYVTDLKNHQVRAYDLKTRELVASFPKTGAEEKARLYSPTNVAVDEEGNVYVSDTGSFCVQIYDRQGNHVRTIGGQGLTPGSFARPKGIAVDREHRVYVADAATQVVQVFDKDGRLLMVFGDPSAAGPGATSLPAGVAVDYANVSYFTRFVAPGKQLEYLVFVVNQYGDPKITVYGFLKSP